MFEHEDLERSGDLVQATVSVVQDAKAFSGVLVGR
jgi:hypothetical protein